MNILAGIEQGTADWLAVRRKFYCSSDAPVMIGASSRAMRADLVRMTANGDEREYSEWVQRNLLDRGHEIEAAARKIAEEIIGEELFPVVGVKGRLLASFDGTTMSRDIIWECKSANQAKFAAIAEGRVHEDDFWQVQQQLVVSGAERCLYMVTDGTDIGTAYLWETLRPGSEQTLLSGWAQFDEDVRGYVHVEDAPKPAAQAIADLPALTVQLVGKVQTSNLDVYRESALSFIASINTDLRTDEDFVNAERSIKFCSDAEQKIDLVKCQALEQTSTIAELFRTLDTLRESMRQKRLELDRLVKARKESIRDEIRRGGVDAYAAHLKALNERLGGRYMPELPVDFAGAMRGKKTLASLRDAVSTELARAKIGASEVADQIDRNLKALREIAAEHKVLFPDARQIVLKAPEDMAALVKVRIAEHQQAEEKRLEEERERIRQEEVRKLEAEGRERNPEGPFNPLQGMRQSEIEAYAQKIIAAAHAAPTVVASPATAPTVVSDPASGRLAAAEMALRAFLREYGDIADLAGPVAAIQRYLSATENRRAA